MKHYGDEELSVIAEIARMYYIEGMTQLEISEMLYFSKAKVSRALQTAREKHIIEFQINYPLRRSMMLESELKRRFDLPEVLVVSELQDNMDADISIKRIGELAAEYLDDKLKDGDSIGLSWGRTIYQTVRQLRPRSDRKIDVVQLVGNSRDTYDTETDIASLVQAMAKSFHGKASLLYAPMYINSEIVREELMREDIIRKAIDKTCQVDYVLTGIADVSNEKCCGTWAGYLSEEKRDELIKKGAAGYLCGYFFDKNGNLVSDPINRKIVGIPFEKVKRGPHLIAVAGGKDKTYAIHAALKGGLIDCLITDSRIAEKLLTI